MGRNGFLKQMLDTLSFKEQIFKCEEPPVQNSNRGYSVPILIKLFFEKNNGSLKLKIILIKKQRKWFYSLLDYPINLQSEIPIA